MYKIEFYTDKKGKSEIEDYTVKYFYEANSKDPA